MGDSDLPQLRRGVQTLMKMALQKSLPEESHDRIPAMVLELEKACLTTAQDGGPDYRTRYAAIYNGLINALPEPYGDFLENILAVLVCGGHVSPAAATKSEVYNAHKSIAPRQRGRALFYSILARDPRFDSADDERRRDYATLIERGCYNAAIVRCTNSADSYQRQWDSPMFVAVYSARVGLVSANIDPTGTVVQSVEGGSWALDKLAEERWGPESLGTMSATELCPQAGKAVRDEVNTRLNQKIVEKTSSFFACPRCHKRNHTYRQIQIGAGDEPSTFMCTCKECGEHYEGYA